MEDIVYESECEYTYELMKEMTTHTRKISYKIYTAVLYFALLFIEYRYIFVYKKIGFSIVIGLVLAVTAVMYFEMPIINAKRQHKSMLAANDNTNMRTRVRIFENGIEHYNIQSGSGVQIMYEDVDKVVETDNLFIILTKENVGIVMDKHNFIKGEPSGFATFMAQKVVK